MTILENEYLHLKNQSKIVRFQLYDLVIKHKEEYSHVVGTDDTCPLCQEYATLSDVANVLSSQVDKLKRTRSAAALKKKRK